LGQDPSPVPIPESHFSPASTTPFPQLKPGVLFVEVLLGVVLLVEALFDVLFDAVLFDGSTSFDFFTESPQAAPVNNKKTTALIYRPVM